MTPTLKGELVKRVQNKGENVVLAIGDGANDVAMIQVYLYKSFLVILDVFKSDLIPRICLFRKQILELQ